MANEVKLDDKTMVLASQFKQATKALEAFRRENGALIEQFEKLSSAVSELQDQAKGALKDLVKKSGQDIETTDNGVFLKAWQLTESKFNVLQLEEVEFNYLKGLHLLAVDAAAYKAAQKDGKVPADLDKKIRTEKVKQINSKVEVA